MTISGIDYLAVVVAATNAFLWTLSYYVILFREFREAAGWSAGEVQGRTSLVTYLVTFIGLLIMACIFSGMFGHLDANQLNAKSGAIYGALIWVGFVVPIIAINNVIGGRKYMLSVIDGINWLGVLVVEGGFIGVMKVSH